MGILLFILLALAVAIAIVYPLLPGRPATWPQPGASDEQIEAAVGRVRRLRRQRGLGAAGTGAAGVPCPACGHTYRPGDAFCVRCGTALPQAGQARPAGRTCPACGAALHAGDEFCTQCGQALPAGEAV